MGTWAARDEFTVDLFLYCPILRLFWIHPGWTPRLDGYASSSVWIQCVFIVYVTFLFSSWIHFEWIPRLDGYLGSSRWIHSRIVFVLSNLTFVCEYILGEPRGPTGTRAARDEFRWPLECQGGGFINVLGSHFGSHFRLKIEKKASQKASKNRGVKKWAPLLFLAPIWEPFFDQKSKKRHPKRHLKIDDEKVSKNDARRCPKWC